MRSWALTHSGTDLGSASLVFDCLPAGPSESSPQPPFKPFQLIMADHQSSALQSSLPLDFPFPEPLAASLEPPLPPPLASGACCSAFLFLLAAMAFQRSSSSESSSSSSAAAAFPALPDLPAPFAALPALPPLVLAALEGLSTSISISSSSSSSPDLDLALPLPLPLGSSSTPNDTRWPSWSSRKPPLPRMALKCTKTSPSPPSGVM
mmetsp:Transcript_26213/g.83147  ORF Transcript_26213/g.83147 Transcript_26213/m.83147 type:complete len:207 (-) Transcript_26213:469-1089(-)